MGDLNCAAFQYSLHKCSKIALRLNDNSPFECSHVPPSSSDRNPFDLPLCFIAKILYRQRSKTLLIWSAFCHTPPDPISRNTISSGVARICCEEGQRWKLCHGALTIDFRAGCSSCSMTNTFVTNAVLMERAVSCWRLHQLVSQTTKYFDSWLSGLLRSELKMKLLEVEEDTCPSAPYWRRHWQ